MDMKELNEKYEKLKTIIEGYGSLAVAFSGGVDSTFLLKAASDALKEKAMAITASISSMPEKELKEAVDYCKDQHIRHEILRFDELEIKGFAENPPDRCCICKKAIFSSILKLAGDNGVSTVAEGSNTDDMGDYRPGLKAIEELGVKSPLKEAGLSKADIRALSKELGLPTWDKQSFACLSSRFPYGETITRKRLKSVEMSEEYLKGLGFTQYRVRVHGNVARVEILPEQFELMLAHRLEIYRRFKEYGFDYISMDLLGYRSGSMNEVL